MKKENNSILEEMRKRFKQINEYIVNGPLSEEGDEEDPNVALPQGGEEGPAMPPQGGAGGEMPPMGPDGGAPQGGEMPPMGPDGGMGGDAPQTPEGFNPQMPPEGGEMPPMDAPPADAMQSDDEVIDVSDLTDAQEKTEKEIKKIGGQYEKIIDAINNFENLVKANDAKIDSLKAEIERRNPTQVEKLSMQTAHSYPFDQTVEDYWKNKEATSNYSTESDENGKNQGQYVITADDVNGNVNWKDIYDSLDVGNTMYNQTLNNILRTC